LTSPYIELYTDGSCHTQIKTGAWASIILLDGDKTVLKGIENNTTHNRMELLAVINAIAFIDEKKIGSPLVIYTDSQYVSRIPERKDKLKSKQFRTSREVSIQNADLVQTLIQQIELHSIRFIKVKAHQKTDNRNAKYNGEVDKMARAMVRESVTRLRNCK
jgi:ribonuclease HI